MKLIVVLAFLAIIVSLGTALYGLVRGGGGSDTTTVRALTWRIGLSIALFLFILFAWRMGWVTPHGLKG